MFVGSSCVLRCDVYDRQRAVKEVVDGIKVYFDRALGVTLLYRFERPQYDDTFAESSKAGKDKELHMSDVYGAEHLLRLFGTVQAIVPLTLV